MRGKQQLWLLVCVLVVLCWEASAAFLGKTPSLISLASAATPPTKTSTTTTSSTTSTRTMTEDKSDETDAHHHHYQSTTMRYIAPSVDVAHVYRDATGNSAGFETIQWVTAPALVKNARELSPPASLHRHGFELRASPLAQQPEQADNDDASSSPLPIDFLDTHHVVKRYYPQCEEILRQVLGPNVAVIKAFDHNIRMVNSTNQELKNGGGSKVQPPADGVHGDYTQVSAPRRLLDLSQSPKVNDVPVTRTTRQTADDGDDQIADCPAPLLDATIVQEAVVQKKRRYAIINIWRSIDPETPVQTKPLACVNAQTVSKTDLRILQIHYMDRIGENYLAIPPDPTTTTTAPYEWMYYPAMTMDEILIIKQWDSHGGLARGQERDDENCATFSIHSAFELEQRNHQLVENGDETNLGVVPPPLKPRKSIEVRCVCIWEPTTLVDY